MRNLVVFCFCVLACLALPIIANQERYTISQGPEGTFILDTQEGNLWIYSKGKHLPHPMLEKVQYKDYYDSERKKIYYSRNPNSKPIEANFEEK